jgi:hypothetical protein
MQLDSAGSSKPGEQHLVALYDPSGKRFGHARVHAHLCDHGTTLAAHLQKKPQPQAANSRNRLNTNRVLNVSRKCAGTCGEGSKKVHVHYHLDSPPPPVHRSRNCRRRSRPASKSRHQYCRHCSRERPVTGPEWRGQQETSLAASHCQATSLSAPSTPWHRQPGCANEEPVRPQEEAAVQHSQPPMNACGTHQPGHQPAVVCDNQAHAQASAPAGIRRGTQNLSNCTVCGSAHHFKTPAMQDITAVACEMMTLVSMRSAMSEVLGSLVHKWRDVMPSTLDLPGLPGDSGALQQAPPSHPPSSDWTIPAPGTASKQANDPAVEPQGFQDTFTVKNAPTKEMLLKCQPSQLSPTRNRSLGQGPAAQRATDARRTMADSLTVISHQEPCDKLPPGRDPADLATITKLHHPRKEWSRDRRRHIEQRPEHKSAVQCREDSMSGPFQVTFAPSTLGSGAKQKKRRSSRRSSSKHPADTQVPPSAGSIPEEHAAADTSHIHSGSIATQEQYSSTGPGWTESAVSIATGSEAAACAAPVREHAAVKLQQSKICQSVPEAGDLAAESKQQACMVTPGNPASWGSNLLAQPVQSHGTRSESMWPLSEDSTAHVLEDCSRSGAGQAEADADNPAVHVSDNSIASSMHGTFVSSQGSEVKSARNSGSKVSVHLPSIFHAQSLADDCDFWSCFHVRHKPLNSTKPSCRACQ